MRHKPKRKILSLLLVFCLLLESLLRTALPVSADNIGSNAYGHQAVYSPVSYLYTTIAHPSYVVKGGTSYANLQSFRLFDATNSIWNNVPAATRSDKGKTKSWLTLNQYLLNRFGCRNDGFYQIDMGFLGKLTVYNTSPKIQNQQDTKLFPGNLRVGYKEGSFHATYNFEGLSWQDTDAFSQYGKNLYSYAIANMNHERTGNIGNMLAKGDIQYFMAFELDGYNHSCIFCDSYDTSILKIFGKEYKKQDFESFNRTKNAPDFGADKAWFPANKLTTLYYSGDSGHDEKISAKLTEAILVGKDIAGPRIKSIKVTSDRAGTKEIPGGAITLNNINSLTDRTVYFQVIWDEPVMFKGLTNAQTAALSLKVQTQGIDGTSGIMTEAPFLSFTPKKSDSTPMMTFEYKIPDPYTDNSQVTQERGYFYKFTKVVVSKNENEMLWNNLYDISGNKFAANSNGQQPAGKVEYAVSGTPFVDLEPFAIKNIRVKKDKQPDKEFVEQGELLSVTLELNKNFAYDVFGIDRANNYFSNGTNYAKLPSITLNIKDPSGQFVTIAPTNPTTAANQLVKKVFDGSVWKDSSPKQHWTMESSSYRPAAAVNVKINKSIWGPGSVKYEANSVTYNIQLYPGYTIDGDTIKVARITSPTGAKDPGGYSLMAYEDKGSGFLEPANLPAAAAGKLSKYKKALDKQYKLDFTPPDIDVNVSDIDNDVIKVKADISDANLWGCDAAFDIKVEGNVNGQIKYQPSSSEAYDGNNWIEAPEGSARIGISGPIMGSGANRNAYAFIKLPDKSEVKSITAAVTVTDEARNSSEGTGKLPPEGETWSGFDKLAPVVALTKDGEAAKVDINDMSPVTYDYEWQDTFEADGATRKDGPVTYTGSGSGNAGEISYTGTLPEGNKIHYKTLWVKAKDSANNQSDPVSMDFALNRTYSEIIINSATTGRLKAGDEARANVKLKNVKRYWYMWLEKPTDYIYKDGTENNTDDDIDYGDAAAFVAGKGWGIFGSRFNGWSPEDPNKKVEAEVANQYTGGFSGFSLNSLMSGDPEGQAEGTVAGAVYTGGFDGKEQITVAGAVYAGLMSGEPYTNETVLDIKLNYDNTQVIRCEDDKPEYKDRKWMLRNDPDLVLQTIPAKDSSRPLVLLIAVEDPSDEITPGATPGNLRFAAIEFDTFYNKPEMSVRQVRFSTNDGGGNRIDHERQSDEGWIEVNEGLYWPMDKFYPWSEGNRIQQSQLMINATTLHDFAEAEFYLGADPATGIDRLPGDGIKLELRKELYRAMYKEEMEDGKPTKLVFDDDGLYIETSKPPVTVQSWAINKDDLTKAQLFADGYINNAIGSRQDFTYGSKAYRFTIKLDPALVDAVPYEIHHVGEDEDGNPELEVWYVRYSFYAVYDYGEDIESPDDELITRFIFDNTVPSARLEGISYEYDSDNYFRSRGGEDMPAATEAVFTVDGGDFSDVTPSPALVTYGSGTENPWLDFEFYDSGLNINGALPHTPSPYMPLTLAARDNENTKLGSQPAVRWGTGDKLEVTGNRVRFKSDAPNAEFTMTESDFISPIYGDAGVALEEFESSLIYYQFYDDIRGVESPIYVVDLRRDETPPAVGLSVSETEMPVKEVQIKVDGLYDIHPATAGDITTYVVDTPTGEIKFELNAWRKVDPGETFNTTEPDGEDYYDEGKDFNDGGEHQYVRVRPDNDGVYTFIRNGYMQISAMDTVGNFTSKLTINGEEKDFPGGELGPVYEVTNIDLDPPKFETDPVWTADGAQGKFTLTVKADNTAAAAYIRFDKEYAEFLTGDNYDEHEVELENGEIITIPASRPPMYAIGNIPGQLGGGFNPATGEIDLTVYIKYGEEKVLKSASIILADSAGNETESEYDFGAGLPGIEPKITNVTTGFEENVNGYPVYSYGGKLNFSAPVMIDMYNTDFAIEHSDLPIYSDGSVPLGYVDLFGGTYVEYVYADIFGPGFSHSVKLYAGDEELDTSATVNKGVTNKNITVKVDTSGTSGLTINGVNQWQTTVTENGNFSYTLSSSTLGSKAFTLPISCIDKTVPEAYVNTVINSSIDEETGETAVYSITYEITGFSKKNVTVIDEEGNSAPISITFDRSSESKAYTFRYRDEAGNIGSYPIDVSDMEFSDRSDAEIKGYRLTFAGSGKDGANTLGIYTSGGEAINLGAANSNIVVKAEALNSSGETVPAAMSLVGAAPNGVTVFTAQKSVLFTLEKETEQKVTVKLTGPANNIEIPITLPAGAIDKTSPIGTVRYVESGSNIKAYLVPLCSDLAEDGVNVTGQKGDGIALKLEEDSAGNYVEFDANGSGYFILKDKAGNIGTVAIAVATIDNEPPKLGAEGWSGVIEAYSKAETWKDDIDRILQTPTNNSIKIFFSFNEQLSKVEVNAYDNSTDQNELIPGSDYVTAIVSGNTVTIEFKQNCQAKISVYDIRGNETVLWRPEDGPITVIDRISPELEADYPKETFADNKVSITYKFKDNEEVILLSNFDEGYKNTHTVEFDKNGQYILTFADRAGNVLSQYPRIERIDELAPHIKLSLGFAGEGKEEGGKDEKGDAFYYTNRNVRILLNVADETAEGLTVTAAKQGGAQMTVTKENVTVDTRNYTHHLTVMENGVYAISAKDKWGHENTAYANVTIIDKTPPTIALASTKAVSVEKNAEGEAVKNAVMQGVTAADAQSGTNGGVTLKADMSEADLANPGSYGVKITATDRLGNESQKTRIVNVLSGELRVFGINGQSLEANDVFITTPGRITVDTSHSSFGGEKVTLYCTQGYKTAAQMKYASPFDGSEGFDARDKGYYTILAQSAERGMYLVYVYIY